MWAKWKFVVIFQDPWENSFARCLTLLPYSPYDIHMWVKGHMWSSWIFSFVQSFRAHEKPSISPFCCICSNGNIYLKVTCPKPGENNLARAKLCNIPIRYTYIYIYICIPPFAHVRLGIGANSFWHISWQNQYEINLILIGHLINFILIYNDSLANHVNVCTYMGKGIIYFRRSSISAIYSSPCGEEPSSFL